jgi:hypothetical protein
VKLLKKTLNARSGRETIKIEVIGSRCGTAAESHLVQKADITSFSSFAAEQMLQCMGDASVRVRGRVNPHKCLRYGFDLEQINGGPGPNISEFRPNDFSM